MFHPDTNRCPHRRGRGTANMQICEPFRFIASNLLDSNKAPEGANTSIAVTFVPVGSRLVDGVQTCWRALKILCICSSLSRLFEDH